MKRKKLAALLCSAFLVFGLTASTAFADGTKVVTLGADLTNDQQKTIMKYFGVTDPSTVDLIYVNNAEEHAALGSYMAKEIIGTRTISCAMVSPTASGGIKVKTANLSYVTCNMIASTLSTSGVKNCEVLACAPFEVSGTGALTGIIKAYETATGSTLSTQKKEIATKEMAVTYNCGQRPEVGPRCATAIMNRSKRRALYQYCNVDNSTNVNKGNINNGTIVNNNITEVTNVTNNTQINNTNVAIGDIENLVINVAKEYNIELTQTEINQYADVINNMIVNGDYTYNDVEETLNMVDINVSENPVTEEFHAGDIDINIESPEYIAEQAASAGTETPDSPEVPEAADSEPEESIMDQVDETAFGQDVITTTTDEISDEVQEIIEEGPVTGPEAPVAAIEEGNDTAEEFTVQANDGSAEDDFFNTESAEADSMEVEAPVEDVSMDAETPVEDDDPLASLLDGDWGFTSEPENDSAPEASADDSDNAASEEDDFFTFDNGQEAENSSDDSFDFGDDTQAEDNSENTDSEDDGFFTFDNGQEAENPSDDSFDFGDDTQAEDNSEDDGFFTFDGDQNDENSDDGFFTFDGDQNDENSDEGLFDSNDFGGDSNSDEGLFDSNDFGGDSNSDEGLFDSNDFGGDSNSDEGLFDSNDFGGDSYSDEGLFDSNDFGDDSDSDGGYYEDSSSSSSSGFAQKVSSVMSGIIGYDNAEALAQELDAYSGYSNEELDSIVYSRIVERQSYNIPGDVSDDSLYSGYSSLMSYIYSR